MTISNGKAVGLGSMIQINDKKRDHCHSNCGFLKMNKPGANTKFSCRMFAESNIDEPKLEKEPMLRRQRCIEAYGTT